MNCRLSSFHIALTAWVTAVCAEMSVSWGSFYEPASVSDYTVFHSKSKEGWWILNDPEGNDREQSTCYLWNFLEGAVGILFFNFSGRNQENHLLSQPRQQVNPLNSKVHLPDIGIELYPCPSQFGSDCVSWRSKMWLTVGNEKDLIILDIFYYRTFVQKKFVWCSSHRGVPVVLCWHKTN